MIHVIAQLTVKPGKRDEMVEAFRKVAPTVQAEPGCLEYGAAVDLQTPIAAQDPLRGDVLTVVEKWDSIAALEAHLATPHMAEFFTATADLRAGLSLQVLQPV